MPIPLNVLVLEDHIYDAELIIHELRRSGYSLTWERVETEAEFVAHLKPDVDLIIADYSLPQFDAPGALNMLKKRNMDVPFIVVTGAISEEVAVEMMKQGADDYLLKDRLVRLGQAVAHALEQKRSRQERQAALDNLRESEERYRVLIEAAPDIIAIFSDRKIDFINLAGAVALGAASPEELVGYPIESIEKPDDIDVALQRWAQLARGENAHCHFETHFVRLDGVEFPVEVILTPIMYMGQNAVQMIARDITERKQSQEELKRSEVRFRTIFESTNDAILLLDPQTGKITDVNDRFCEIFGLTIEEAHQTSVEAICSGIPPYTFQDLMARINRASQEASQLLEWQVKNKAGDLFWIELNVRRAVIGEVECLLVAARDISERKRMEEQIKLAQARLAQANRLASIGRLASSLAHQIYNPLTVTIAEAQLLKHQNRSNDSIRTSTQAIVEAGRRAQQVIEALLSLSETSDENTIVSINETLQQALVLVKPQLATFGVHLDTEVQENLNIRGDKQKIIDLWMNLMMVPLSLPGGDSINQMWIRAEGKDQRVVVSFSNNGMHVTPEDAQVIFDPQVLPTSITWVNGMELTLCQELVRQHNGSIAFSSRDNISIFEVILPKS